MTSARSGVGFTAKVRSTLSAWRSRIWLPQVDSGARPFAGREVLVEVGLLADDNGDPQHAALLDAIERGGRRGVGLGRAARGNRCARQRDSGECVPAIHGLLPPRIWVGSSP